MRKTFCDRCGKEITEDVEWVFDHELCPECVKAVDLFITHPTNITEKTETNAQFFHMPCTLCGNNCQVSPLEQFKVRNELCEAREQMYRRTENE